MSDLHAQTVAYVRETMLPQKPPPASQQGAIKWLRENLFSGPLNIALTVLGALAIFLAVRAALPWFLNGVWNAASLEECRKIVMAANGQQLNAAGDVVNAAGEVVPMATGACWAMLRERWHQFIFGFYPMDQYWRPVLAFALMFAAMAPVLFIGNARTALKMVTGTVAAMVLLLILTGTPAGPMVAALALGLGLVALAYLAPARLIWFTILFPALTFWLLWGGSVWRPVLAMAGFALSALAYRLAVGRLGVVVAAAVGAVVAVLWWLYGLGPVQPWFDSLMPLGLQAVSSDRFGGFLLAITIGVTAISGSLPLGILLALGRRSDMLLIKTLSVGFIEFVRGVPLITVLFTASLLLQYFLPPRTNFDIILRVIIMATLFAAAYIAEVIRGGLAALPRGQYEAADALGLDYWQAQRLIIMPQALKISIPGIVSSFIGLFKDTTLVAFVGLMDPLKGITQVVRADSAWKGIYWEPYLFVGAIFFAICFGMSRYSMYLERKLMREHR